MYKVLLLLSLIGLAAWAPAPPPVEAEPASTAYRDEALARLSSIEEKVVGLAEAVPGENYTWRPGEGVRSVSEVYLHIAGANYGIPNNFGTPAPEGFSFDGYEAQTTDKAEIVAKVKESFAHIRGAIEKLRAEQSEEGVKMFGQDMTTRQAVWFALEHLSEHLGQSIAYARVNKVVPPWSSGEE